MHKMIQPRVKWKKGRGAERRLVILKFAGRERGRCARPSESSSDELRARTVLGRTLVTQYCHGHRLQKHCVALGRIRPPLGERQSCPQRTTLGSGLLPEPHPEPRGSRDRRI